MRRLFLYCLIGLPIWAHAESSDVAPIPAPPEMSPQNSKAATSVDKKAVAKKASPDEEAPPSDTPEAPESPMPVQSGENLEPDITIKRKGQETIQEFRQGGKLYMVKVVPDVGPAYYWIDSDNDGTLDAKRSDMDKDAKIHMWKVFEWK